MPSRREMIELDEQEIKEYLAAQKTIIIVSNGRNGYPHPMPMWFHADDDGVVYCTTFRKSQKVMNLSRDPKAALLVESGEEYAELKSLLIYATAEVIDDFEQVRDTLIKISTKGQALDQAERAAVSEGLAQTATKRVVLKFTPQSVVSWDHRKLGGRY